MDPCLANRTTIGKQKELAFCDFPGLKRARIYQRVFVLSGAALARRANPLVKPWSMCCFRLAVSTFGSATLETPKGVSLSKSIVHSFGSLDFVWIKTSGRGRLESGGVPGGSSVGSFGQPCGCL